MLRSSSLKSRSDEHVAVCQTIRGEGNSTLGLGRHPTRALDSPHRGPKQPEWCPCRAVADAITGKMEAIGLEPASVSEL